MQEHPEQEENPQISAEHRRSSALKGRHPNRGGPRPGAGAPKGNLNALKHGRRSAQFAQLGVILAGNPKTRDAMLNFARRLHGKQDSAIKGAIELHACIIEEARKIARGEPSPLEHLLRDSSSPSPGKPVRERKVVRLGREDQDSNSLVPGSQFLAPGSISRCRSSLNQR